MPFSGATMDENELSWRIQLLPPQVSFDMPPSIPLPRQQNRPSCILFMIFQHRVF